MSKTSISRDEVMASRGYVSVATAAGKIGQAVNAIYRWMDEGKVEGVRVGRKRYVSTRSLAGYLGADAARIFGLAP